MKILYVITLAEIGGSQMHVLDLLRGFRHAYELTLATGENGFLTEEAERLGVPVHVLPDLVHPLRPYHDAKAVAQAIGLIRKVRPDLVHCHTSKAGIVGRIAARMCGVPAVFTAHSWSFSEESSSIRKWISIPAERAAGRWTQKIIAVSESNKTLALRNRVARETKITTVYNGIEDTPHRSNPAAGLAARIVMVARFAEPKNQTELLEAVAGCRPPFRLTFIGDGPTKPAVEQAVDRLNLRDQVEFLGTRKDVDEKLAESSILALATRREGLPISVLEGMRAGLPVIATEVGGVRETVCHNTTGFLYREGDVESLRRNLDTLLQSPDLRTRLGAAGRRALRSSFYVSRDVTEDIGDLCQRSGVPPTFRCIASRYERRTRSKW